MSERNIGGRESAGDQRGAALVSGASIAVSGLAVVLLGLSFMLEAFRAGGGVAGPGALVIFGAVICAVGGFLAGVNYPKGHDEAVSHYVAPRRQSSGLVILSMTVLAFFAVAVLVYRRPDLWALAVVMALSFLVWMIAAHRWIRRSGVKRGR